MQYLAQVISKDPQGTAKLQLLAAQKTDYVWVKLTEEAYIFSEDAVPFGEGALVVLQLVHSQKIQAIQDAKGWLLNILEDYLSVGISPKQMREEVERAE